MSRWARFWLLALIATATGCASDPAPESSPDPGWRGETLADADGAIVVRTTGGSVWDAPARLREELSIGVEAGAGELMFGDLSAMWATDETIFVVDRQAPAVRMYGFDGAYKGMLGGEGEGPGEYRMPNAIAVAADGRIYVREIVNGRVNVYSAAGDSVDTLFGDRVLSTPDPLVVAADGSILSPSIERLGAQEYGRAGYARIGKDGPEGEIILPPVSALPEARFSVGEFPRNVYLTIPYLPRAAWTLAPGSAAMVHGTGDVYRITVESSPGPMVIERDVSPIPVPAAEIDWRRSYLTRLARSIEPGWSWDVPGIPAFKPAFDEIHVGHDGRIWVVRSGAGELVDDCTIDIDNADLSERVTPCWRSGRIVDVFDADGRYLGEVDWPEGAQINPWPFIRGDLIVAAFLDEVDTPMAKVYRLVH